MLSSQQQFQQQQSSSNSTGKKIALAVGGSLALLAIGYVVKSVILGSSGTTKKTEESSKQPEQQTSNKTTSQQSTSAGTSVTTKSEPVSPQSQPQQQKSSPSIPIAEQEKLIIARKTAGNTFFTQGRLDQAIECYQSCIDLADACGTTEARKQGGVAMSNAMQCLLKQKRYQEVENSATFFLETVWSEAADNMLTSKVLYRRAQARVNLDHEKEAIEDLKQASSKTDGKFMEVEQLLQKLSEKQEKSTEKK